MSHFFFDTTMLKNPNQKEIPHASPQGRGVSKIDSAAFVINVGFTRKTNQTKQGHKMLVGWWLCCRRQGWWVKKCLAVKCEINALLLRDQRTGIWPWKAWPLKSSSLSNQNKICTFAFFTLMKAENSYTTEKRQDILSRFNDILDISALECPVIWPTVRLTYLVCVTYICCYDQNANKQVT